LKQLWVLEKPIFRTAVDSWVNNEVARIQDKIFDTMKEAQEHGLELA
jgi:hypothetical protein